MQAKPKQTHYLNQQDFAVQEVTTIYWLTGAGVMVNARGTVLLIDPVLGYLGTDTLVSECYRKLLAPTPILPEKIPLCDAVLYTHRDADHFSENTIQKLQWGISPTFYVPSEDMLQQLRFFGVCPEKRKQLLVGETLEIGNVRVTRTPAVHNWQAQFPEHYDWEYQTEDCTGYRIETEDGVIWITGDTKLLPEYFAMKDATVVFLDYSRSASHFGEENAIALSNALSDALLVPYHWGTYDEPEQAEFNADPEAVRERIVHSERLRVLEPGERLMLRQGCCQ